MGDSKSPIPPEADHSTSPVPPDARGVEHSGKAGSLLGITALVIADALSKITAVLLLPAGEPVRREAALQLVLSLNDLGLGSWARTLADRNDEFEWDLPKAVALFALAGAVLFVRRFPHRRSTRFWFLVAVAIFALTSAVSVVLAEITPSVSHRTAVLLTRAGQSALWLTLWSIGAAGVWRHACALMAASALGNFLSLCYPPYAIVDFGYSAITRRVFGLGVFNLADVFHLIGLALLGVAVVRGAAPRLLVATGRRVATEDTPPMLSVEQAQAESLGPLRARPPEPVAGPPP